MKFDFPISLAKPMKLCDFKPSYGYVFAEYLGEYDYWGYCDIDEYYGDLSKWLSREHLAEYDRVYSLGHMSIYRNCSYMNELFMRRAEKTCGKSITTYQQIFQSDRIFAFDEWPSDCASINGLSEEAGISVCWDFPMADILPFRSDFILSLYSQSSHEWLVDCEIEDSIIVFRQGKLFLYWKGAGRLSCREIPYAHVQKRRLDVSEYNSGTDFFAIMPNKVISSQTMLTEDEIARLIRSNKYRRFLRIDENKRRMELQYKWLTYQLRKRMAKLR